MFKLPLQVLTDTRLSPERLAQGLDILTTAEGVESCEQLEYLRATGVDFVQGYLFAAPAALSGIDPQTVIWSAVSVAS